MTEERRLELEEKLNEAEARGDVAGVAAVKMTMDREYRECTSHTADRLKRVEKTVNQIKEGLIPATMFDEIKEGLGKTQKEIETHMKEVEEWKNKIKGARVLWGLLGGIVTAGGGAILLRVIEAFSHK